MSLQGKVILLTGGTGSFGQKFTEIALRDHEPASIRVFSRGEFLQWEMERRFGNDPRLRFFIGDVRDKERVSRAMNGVDIVVHAAALKQVPTCEYNPIEAVKTNIDGAVNIIDAAIDNNVAQVMAISTDKAAHPVNLYGATKLVAEKLITQGNSYVGHRRTRFSCVRYGNVIGSRGSVVPLFLEQKEAGRITITDERMTRFWITLDQGVRFVIDCIDRMKGGEVFVPKMASMKVTDLAEVVAPEAERVVTGIRPGEKLHEVLVMEEEARHASEHDSYYVIQPEFELWDQSDKPSGKSVPDDFRYASDTNNWWYTREELRSVLDTL